VAAATSTAVLLSAISGAAGEVFFLETFDEGFKGRWMQGATENEPDLGNVTLAPLPWPLDKNDRALKFTERKRHYRVVAEFPSFSNRARRLFVQYQVTNPDRPFERCNDLSLRIGPHQDELKSINKDTPFYIKFGPVNCEDDHGNVMYERTDLEFGYHGRMFRKVKDLKFKQNVPVKIWGQSGVEPSANFTHLYRLTLMPDSTVRVDIDRKEVYRGPMAKGWGIGAGEMIPDSMSRKPYWWDDNAFVVDPEDVKPKNWKDDEPEFIESPRPADWDEAEEGGEYVPRKLRNPAYRGEWKPNMRKPNPEYMGQWRPRMIPNPGLHELKDLWSKQRDHDMDMLKRQMLPEEDWDLEL